MASYFILLLVSIAFVLAVSIIRTRHRHQLEAKSMRRHLLQREPRAGKQ